MTQDSIRPFISYAREDSGVAQRLLTDLRLVGADPWIDTDELIGGEEWDAGIRKAIRGCSHFILLISRSSVDKRGYVQ